MRWVLMPLSRMTDFAGRSRRTEFWIFALAILLGQLIVDYGDAATGSAAMIGRLRVGGALFMLAALLPMAAVSVRRMHDIGRSGWWMAALFLPYAIWIATPNDTTLNSAALLVFAVAALGLLVLLVQPGVSGANRYGENPKRLDDENLTG